MSTLQATNLKHASSASNNVVLDASGNTLIGGVLSFNSGYGSSATAYGCRAWVNFNGTGTVAIRASGNVTSITDNGTGNYTVNITTAMPDANYVVSGMCRNNDDLNDTWVLQMQNTNTKTSSAFQFTTREGGGATDSSEILVIFVR